MLRVPAAVLAEATGGYAASKRLGEGSFAAVFIGRIPSHRHNEIVDGTGEAGGEAAKEELTSGPVAIKLLFERPEDGVSEEQREYYRKAEEVSSKSLDSRQLLRAMAAAAANTLWAVANVLIFAFVWLRVPRLCYAQEELRVMARYRHRNIW